MSKGRSLWLLLAMVASAGINAAMQPRLAYELADGDRTLATGTLALSGDGVTHELKLITVYALATELTRWLGDPIVVRELWVRSPEEAGQSGPDLELFFDFNGPNGALIDAAARNISDLRGRELGVLPVALGGGPKSRIRLPGGEQAAQVVSGHLLLRRALDYASGSSRSWRVEGDLLLTLAQPDAEHTLLGKLTGRLQWN